jgi:hypothetical protein
MRAPGVIPATWLAGKWEYDQVLDDAGGCCMGSGHATLTITPHGDNQMTIHQSLQGSSCGHDGQLSGEWFRREDKGINTFKQRSDSVGTNGCSYVPAFASVLTIYR